MFHNDYDVLTAYEAMDYLGIGENTLYRLLNSGELGAFRIGRIWKVPRKELDKYIDKSVKESLRRWTILTILCQICNIFKNYCRFDIFLLTC